jgi:hypothetical protein
MARRRASISGVFEPIPTTYWPHHAFSSITFAVLWDYGRTGVLLDEVAAARSFKGNTPYCLIDMAISPRS